MAAKLWQIIKDFKWHIWDSVCSNALDPQILFKDFREIQNRSTSPPTHTFLFLRTVTISLTQIFNRGSFQNTLVRMPPTNQFQYGDDDIVELNKPFSISELQES